MTSPSKLRQKMLQSKIGWRADDVVALLRGHGFECAHRGKHIVCVHRVHRSLRSTITRASGDIPIGYITNALGLLDAADRLDAGAM